ncbi:MAG: 50S ribosomal protein L11 methyltransferase [Bacteroidales bacterium]|jgi:ribosomal protein L11 methyltransferase|nr:50S ribosomal protein L11 methyltransferase [Bacteroidales bacterium]
MTYTKIQIKTSSLPDFLPDILIAKLADMGVESFEEQNDSLFAYGKTEELQLDDVAEFLTQMIISFEMEEIPEQNWNKKWEENFKFVEVDDKVLIHADFHKPEKLYPHVIKIHPKMAFGTGHHQTTRLVIRHMLNLDFNAKTVLDFGAGTAVLAILAEQMGAKSILAVDMDEWAINNANENIQINQCKTIQVKQSNGDDLKTDALYDVILANVNKNALLDRKNILIDGLKPSGILILSGLLENDLPEIQTAYEKSGLKFETINQENEWIAVKFVKSAI